MCKKYAIQGFENTGLDCAGVYGSHIDHFGKSSPSGPHFGSTLASFGEPFEHHFREKWILVAISGVHEAVFWRVEKTMENPPREGTQGDAGSRG